MTRRKVFVAVTVPAAVSEKLTVIGENLMRQFPREIVSVPTEHHITLRHVTLPKFGDEFVDDMIEAITRALSHQDAFELHVGGSLGAFSNWRSARVLWAGIDKAGTRVLTVMQRRIDEAITDDCGLARSTFPFRPHVTVALPTVPLDARFVKVACDTGTFPVGDVRLYETIKQPEGPSLHRELHRFSLQQKQLALAF